MGRFNPLVANLATPAIPLVQSWARAYDGAQDKLIDMSQAVPGYPPPPDMLECLGRHAASRASAGYGAIEGEAGLRGVLAAHESTLYGASLSADNIHITAGCNEAFVASVMAVAGPGDRILMTNPYYFNHQTTLDMFGIGIDLVDTDFDHGFLPDPAKVAAAIGPKTRAFAIVTPNNPTGAIYPPALIEALFDVCEQAGIWLILDETYRDFLPDAGAAPHGAFRKPNWQDTLVGLYSFSKSFCIPGHRLGAITASPSFVENVAKIMDNLQICPPRPAQAAVAEMFGPLAAWRDENRAEIGRRAEALKSAITGAPGWEIAAIGAYFAFIKHPFAGRPSMAVAEDLGRVQGISCLPGAFFGPGLDRHLRFAFANADRDTIALLSDRLPRAPV